MDARQKIISILDQLNTVLVGKSAQVQDCVACLLAGGHLLIEDVPGVGKTTLAHALARTFGLQFSRVQFTADLMPSDLSGVAVFERSKEAFVFHPGPVFAQVLLADEINRASPKTQSALLEAMEEKQVTVEGETRALPSPFFVIATQNPHDQLGTYALPESQMDRFLMRISLGYPDRQAERQLLAGSDRRDMVTQLQPLLAADELQQLQLAVQQVHVADPLLDYVQDLIAATRSGRWFLQGLSPRAGIALVRAAQAQALISGRDYVAPDDVQAILPQTAAHRLIPVGDAGRGAVEQVRAMLDAVPLSRAQRRAGARGHRTGAPAPWGPVLLPPPGRGACARGFSAGSSRACRCPTR
jgi:MoxR-like ATPase